MLRAIMLVLIVVAAISAFLAQASATNVQIINDEDVKALYSIELADTPKEREIGLMNRHSLGTGQGMLFIFEEAAEGITFWMKNTFIPLDMIFVNDRKVIFYIEENVQPHDLTARGPKTGKTKYVLEVNAGEVEKNEIEVGDRLAISNKSD